ncbi:hypothetical protein TNCT_446071 [Trichonephila clavata]|uniref:Uncharacterized protein n=1 Tax=Trichonephila clavata TaxID=2740835 RepID=A0A8X6L5Q4_TRICU|nr:hypothetical protein TNCT_446071 [Trichonephila clavata]
MQQLGPCTRPVTPSSECGVTCWESDCHNSPQRKIRHAAMVSGSRGSRYHKGFLRGIYIHDELGPVKKKNDRRDFVAITWNAFFFLSASDYLRLLREVLRKKIEDSAKM